ncbi:sulfopyruvate decarboxylase, beta subunit [Methanomethylovorans hollandica DSM 15978]|uniref:sulfopyruvate decarboxylase n=2 Tax=Methanomethylovorans hollandica TaxID=101192 RepID=L0L0N5_METHD|nr:sulfopyruvate decarboxylase, beta subunit [Methanomethylovorans hollandica DSM 15978]
MIRLDAIKVIADKAKKDGALLISNIGIPSKELYYLCDTQRNFYMLGSMGLASSIGLGLSLAQPQRRVITIEGDGSMLMNLGSLATIASQHPENYLLTIIDNGTYGSTGDEPTATSMYTDLAAVAKGVGIKEVYDADDPESLIRLLEEVKSGVIVVKVQPGNAQVPVIDICPEVILERFMDEMSDYTGF